MKKSVSLQARLALTIGLSVTVLWLVAAAITAHRLTAEMEDVFDDGLRSTAQRILPIALHDLREGHKNRDLTDHDDGPGGDEIESHEGREARYGDDVTFLIRADNGRIILASKDADAAIFPPFVRTGFVRTDTHQIYFDASTKGHVTIAVAEPLAHRKELSQKMLLGLILPLAVVIPVSLLAIFLAVRGSLRPVRVLQQELSHRGAQNLSPLPDSNLPSELRPISAGINQLLDRLKAAFSAERAFAANAAHELRTPVAGAIAQAQRIRSETTEELTGQRASEITHTLKRLMRMSEKLMQLARAEGGRLQSDEPFDLRTVLNMIVQDFTRVGEGRIELNLPDAPVMSRLDPDAVGILFRNLIENALKHGAHDCQVEAMLQPDGTLSVANDGPVLSADIMQRLMLRFERGSAKMGGSGLGLSIIKAITERTGMTVNVISPRPMKPQGVEVQVALPLA
ncbi:ATP-binding protein [Rhizobium oryziradicis]|uniref:histidine kinase n=1 Tax=Rhizobium oryziradicis TaxID=1867956 RepID=A0A1Q8ZS64_9HYPH|nr:ATP-binding protein [Rhizobium oryziradicis]OLP44901.1 two-component sensor histidine kinase [Rhizobium oryziradicis]